MPVKHKNLDGERVIESLDDIRVGVRALRRKCAAVRHMHDTVGNPPLRRMTPDFAGLARIVVGQQLSIASAAAIWHRLEALGPITPRRIARLSAPDLRSVGLSEGKSRTLYAAAAAVLDEGLDLAELVASGDDTVRRRLIEITGIGPWTADIFVMFGIGRADAWAPGDLALQVSTAQVLGLADKPDAAELARLAERWRPWRGIAARLLWAHYAHIKLTPKAPL